MKYTSTRDFTISCSFETAICSGYAPDGGLFIPEYLPPLTVEMLQKWALLSFPDLAEEVLRLFVSEEEIPSSDLHRICQGAFQDCFPEPVVPVKTIIPDRFYVAELFHGPTFCFKDLGMRVVIQLLSYFTTRKERRVVLVVSTTGDTGPAAARAVADANTPLLNLLVHYPQDQISTFQRRQLTTVQSPYVHVVTFQGSGDDMDVPIKRMLASPPRSDDDASRRTQWTGVNSYNIGRPLMQMVHYIWSYLFVAKQRQIPIGDPTQTVDFILPTGAMGNIAGGYMVKKMGLPVGILCSGVNVNDITDRVIRTGKFQKSPAMLKTLSDAINIQVPYNLERLLFYLVAGGQQPQHNQLDTDEDDTYNTQERRYEKAAQLVRTWMEQVEREHQFALPTLWADSFRSEFTSARITDEEMCQMMRDVATRYQYRVDPHTAVAFAAAARLGYLDDDLNATPDDTKSLRCRQESRTAVLLATASPCKFEESVTVAIGKEGWDQYEKSSDFPLEARAVLVQPEQPPTVYKAVEGHCLDQNQVEWERMARQIIAEKFDVLGKQ